MNHLAFSLAGARLLAHGGGVLLWPEQELLVVSDLHFGKSARGLRRGGALLPPYETRDTLLRLAALIDSVAPRRVLCLGDSFDHERATTELDPPERQLLARLQAGRDWIWIEGNHDPDGTAPGGAHLAELRIGALLFRHQARPGPVEGGEISGHFHPKAGLALRGGGISRPCFLVDRQRLVMPAFGTFTGGLRSTAPELSRLMLPGALAILTGARPVAIAMPRAGAPDRDAAGHRGRVP